MCKVRVVHFTQHDHRPLLATTLFCNSNTDFIAPSILQHTHTSNPNSPFSRTTSGACCRPQHIPDLLSLNREAGVDRDGYTISRSRFPGLEACPFHACCLYWCQTMLCKWYFDNRDEIWLGGVDGVEMYCPNLLVVGEYQPVGMVLEAEREEGGPARGKVDLGVAIGEDGRVVEDVDEEGNGDDEEEDEDEEEEESEEVPVFPAGELFYSDEIIEGQAVGAGSMGLSRDRMIVQDAGCGLHFQKMVLENACSAAKGCLDALEQCMVSDDGLRQLASDPSRLLQWWKLAKSLVAKALRAEQKAAGLYVQMMKHAAFALTVLNRMPAPGESLTSADGSYSVSREELDLGELDAQAAIDACDGPLKMAGKLAERVQAVKKDMLRLSKRVNRKAGPVRSRPATSAPKKSLKSRRCER